MNLFDVYPLFDINIVKGKGCHVWDEKGTEYLDLYGGHARYLHWSCASALRGDDKQASCHVGILFQLCHQQVTGTGC